MTYRGWPDAIIVGNGVVEAVVVPAVGRVMQFRFVGETEGPFWENPGLRGRRSEASADAWTNFGGDKAWPAPQDTWGRQAGRAWPPPAGFDGLPMTAESDDTGVTLISAVDAGYGIRVRRRIELAAAAPEMTITTRFEKVAGPPVSVGVWTITQVRDPVAVAAVRSDPPPSAPAYVRLSEDLPADLKVTGDLITLARAPQGNRKIGVRSASLFWIGRRETLRIDSALVPGASYPDHGSSAEIYTNADPLPYVELEFLGPLESLAAGGQLERRSVYTLAHRTGPDSAGEIRRLMRP